MAEEGAVAAIMLNHEEAHEQAGGRHREQQTEPIAEVERRPHQDPQQNERHDRDRELRHAAYAAGLAIASKNPCPRPDLGLRAVGASWMLRVLQCRVHHLNCARRLEFLATTRAADVWPTINVAHGAETTAGDKSRSRGRTAESAGAAHSAGLLAGTVGQLS